jgi:hypothetical protein
LGFLSWFKNNPEEAEESQLELFDSSQTLTKRERVDGATVRRDFNQAVKDSGGDKEAQAKSTVAMTEELFGCKPKTLYEQTGGKVGDRSTLPKEAQKAFIVGETVATHDLKAKEITGNQQQKNQQIVDTVSDSGKKARGLFPW